MTFFEELGRLLIQDHFIVKSIRKMIVEEGIRHLYGPATIDYDLDELIVLCLVRDGQWYIQSFIEHYFALGVKHIVFLDNQSADDTVSLAQGYENVTILQTDLPYKEYEVQMKLHLINRFGKKCRWCLYVDIDEFFDYPFSDIINLPSFLAYLNANAYTAVVAHMLDMFSDRAFAKQRDGQSALQKDCHKFYDVSDIAKRKYRAGYGPLSNLTSNDQIKEYFGGIRKTLFNTDTVLTKHPLLFLDGIIDPMRFSSHNVYQARVADLSCVLFHYKFLDHFYDLVLRAVREENYYGNSKEYKQYYNALKQNPRLQIKRETAQELTAVNDLIDDQFLVISKNYANWIKEVTDEAIYVQNLS